MATGPGFSKGWLQGPGISKGWLVATGPPGSQEDGHRAPWFLKRMAGGLISVTLLGHKKVFFDEPPRPRKKYFFR